MGRKKKGNKGGAVSGLAVKARGKRGYLLLTQCMSFYSGLGFIHFMSFLYDGKRDK